MTPDDTSNTPERPEEPVEAEKPARTQTRRKFLIRSLGIGGAGVVAGLTLLAACWPFGDDDDDEPEDQPTATPSLDREPTPDATPEPEPTPTPDATATPEPTPTPEPAPDEPQSGGVLTIALPADPYSLHPNADESETNWMVMSQLYDALMEVDDQFEPVPVLAESFEIADDGRLYRFSIPDSVRFHNGDILTADDVVYTHEWMSVPENGAARSFYYERVDSIDAVDDLTIEFTMSGPDGTFLRRAASTFIVNADYHDEFGQERQSREPVGTGPFALNSWQRGTSLTLLAFSDYYGGAPYLGEIAFQVIPDDDDRRSALEDGSIDVAWDLPIDDDLELDDDDGILSFKVTNLDCTHIALNNQQELLSDRNVRLAMQYAIDRAELVDVIYQGAADEAMSYLSPALFYWHQEMLEPGRQLIDEAIELLEEAGWEEGSDGVRERDGEQLTFSCVAPDGQDPRRDGAEAVAEMLSGIGIEMNVETAPLSETLGEMRAGEIDSAIFNWTYGGWLGEPDGRTTLLTGAFNNFSQFSSVQVDNILFQGIAETDPESRRTVYRSLQERVLDLSPFLVLVFPHDYYHVSLRVQGLPDSVRWGSRVMRKLSACWVYDPN